MKYDVPGIGIVSIRGEPGRFTFEYAEAYKAPTLSYELLRGIADHFGTEKIDTSETIDIPGCETCDFGSLYGFAIVIEGATRNDPFSNPYIDPPPPLASPSDSLDDWIRNP